MNQKNILMIIGALVVVAAVGYFVFGSGSLNKGPVAVVNGKEVSRQDYKFIKEQVEQRASLQGQDLSNKEIKQQAIDQLVAQTLIFQKAEEEGFTVEEEAIDEQYQNVIDRAGGEDSLNQTLEDLNLSEEYIREDIRQQLVIQKYVNSRQEGQDLSVTDKEVSDFYSQLTASQENAPAFEDVESQIRSSLEQQKQGQFVSQIVSELKEDAEIEILL